MLPLLLGFLIDSFLVGLGVVVVFGVLPFIVLTVAFEGPVVLVNTLDAATRRLNERY